MTIGDKVEVLGQLGVGEDSTGLVERIGFGRVIVRFPDGWRRFYNPEQLRVVDKELRRAAGMP